MCDWGLAESKHEAARPWDGVGKEPVVCFRCRKVWAYVTYCEVLGISGAVYIHRLSEAILSSGSGSSSYIMRPAWASGDCFLREGVIE